GSRVAAPGAEGQSRRSIAAAGNQVESSTTARCLGTQLPVQWKATESEGCQFMPVGRDLDNGENTGQRQRYEMLASVRKRVLSIFSARILDSSVERGIPRRAAAPEGPNTRPRLARNASSTIAFSCAASEPDNPTPAPN